MKYKYNIKNNSNNTNNNSKYINFTCPQHSIYIDLHVFMVSHFKRR